MKLTRRAIYGSLCAALSAIALWPLASQATIEEQRARLPPPVEPDRCIDDVSGLWQGQAYNVRARSWQIYRLFIRRTQPSSSELTGELRVRFWIGNPTDTTPPTECKAFAQHAEVQQNGSGTVTGNQLQFGGSDWRLETAHCGAPASIMYNPDHFSGTIDPATQEFQSVNNDGATAINQPTVFRRVQCEMQGVARPGVVIVPAGHPSTAIEIPQRRRLFGCGR